MINVQNDMATVVRASQHEDMDHVSSSNQQTLRHPEVDAVVGGSNLPQQDMELDLEPLQVDMETNQEDLPPPPPPRRPAVVAADSALLPQSALNLVTARSCGGKKHNILLARMSC